MNDVAIEFDRPPSALAYMLSGARPSHRRVPIDEFGAAARWHGHRVDPETLADFLVVTGLPGGPYLPLLYPHVFGFRLAMVILTRPTSPFPIWNVLQTRNHLLQHRPIAVTDPLDFETRVSATRHLDRGAELDLHTAVRAGGALAWESLVTFYFRGRAGAPGPASPLAAAPAADGHEVAAWSMRDGQHWQFGAFTGDYNGIHMWNWYARRFGFPRALYHPARVLGECLTRLPALDPHQPRRLDVWLRGPVGHGARVRLHAHSAAGATRFALYAADPRPSLVGRWSTAPAPAGLIDPGGAPLPVPGHVPGGTP